LPLVFDQRVKSREKTLIEAHTEPGKPIILTKFDGWNGIFATDEPRFGIYPSSVGQAGESTIMTAFYGGALAGNLPVTVAHGPAGPELTDPVLEIVGAYVPALRDSFNGKAWLDSWPDDEYSYGAYSMFRPGQFTRFWRTAGATRAAPGGESGESVRA